MLINNMQNKLKGISMQYILGNKSLEYWHWFRYLKNKLRNKSKNLCLVKFEVLGYKNTQTLLHIAFISSPQTSLNMFGCAKKMTEMRYVEGHCVWLWICMNFSFGIAAVGSGFVFQDDNKWPHRIRIVENFHERKIVMTKHIIWQAGAVFVYCDGVGCHVLCLRHGILQCGRTLIKALLLQAGTVVISKDLCELYRNFGT